MRHGNGLGGSWLRCAAAVVLWAAGMGPATAIAQLKPDQVPTFQARARIVSSGGMKPQGKEFRLQWSGIESARVTTQDGGWSDWLAFGKPQVAAILKGYPASYMRGFPLVVRLSVTGVADPARIEAELKFDDRGEPIPLAGELFGPNLGIMVWKDENAAPRAATMATYNKRYWKHLESVDLSKAKTPKAFPIVDRFIGGDDDRVAWDEGIGQLNRAGFSAIMLPPSARIRDLLLKTGQRRTSWAVYSPPGYAFDFAPGNDEASLKAWAQKQAKPYRDAGYSPEDMAVFALSDEPGWYYPQAFTQLAGSPRGMERFREYLKETGLSPSDFGLKSWQEAAPAGRSQSANHAGKKLFYWTARFFARESARYFADSTRALEEAFRPGMPIFTNWNFFSGRFFVPGPVANNRDKQSPDAAMGGHDWFEFAKLRGGTMLWTEDWFSDAQAYQWSFYCSKLRSAAERGGVEFGGYVIPRTAGDRKDGILQKILCVAGSGGKAIKYFVFGPEYNFPGNCYSERAEVLPAMARAHSMLGAAEEVIWPGRRPNASVAILAPRSAQAWDAKSQVVAKGISDATNNQLNRATVDYMAEVFDLYLALQHANIPVDFVSEDDLTKAGLSPYKVVYITEPDIPAEGQKAIAEWTASGGIAATVTGAGMGDRYGEPCTLLSDAFGFREEPRERLIVADAKSLPASGSCSHPSGTFTITGPLGRFIGSPEGVSLRSQDGAPLMIERPIGKGFAIHFPWFPGISYWKSSTGVADRLPVGFSPAIRECIVSPVRRAGVTPPVQVDKALVETPILLSDKGAAVTVLNWTGAEVPELAMTIRVPFAVKEIRSVNRGVVAFGKKDDGVHLTLPLGSADILILKP